MAKIYVTSEMPFDFTGAERFGEIAFLTNSDLNNIRGSLHNEQLIRNLRYALRNFVEEQDYVLITGSPYVAAVVFMILGARGVKMLRLLRWSNRDRVYAPMHIELRANKGEDDGQVASDQR